jgi:hypothetical protein
MIMRYNNQTKISDASDAFPQTFYTPAYRESLGRRVTSVTNPTKPRVFFGAQTAGSIAVDVAEWLMLPRFSEPLGHNKSCSFDEAAHDKFMQELLALGDKAVAVAGKAGKRKAKTAAAGVIEQYRALSGAARTAYFKANGAALFAAVKAGK